MNARRIGYLAVFVTALASGWYFFLYLTKWEWNRALVSGIIFLAAEMALFGSLLLERIGKISRAVDTLQNERPAVREPRPEVLARVRETAPEPRNPFAWLSPDRSNVFVPVLLGAGVIMSAVAWLVERVARATAGSSMERGLALRLEPLAPPEGGLLERTPDAYALFAPTTRPGP